MKKVTALLIAIIILLSLSACSSDTLKLSGADNQIQAVSIVIGNHACSQEINLNAPIIRQTLEKAVSSYGFVSVISVDGDPDLVSAANYDIPSQYKRADPKKLEQDAQVKVTALLQTIQTIEADSPEVDTLAAIRLAARSFSAAPEEAEKTIIVVDSGLSTSGYCDFTNHLLLAEPEMIVDALAEKGALPNLLGIHVIWQQLGDVAYPQNSMTPRQVQQLKTIWQAIVEGSGGTFELSDIPPNITSAERDLPLVSVVELAADPPLMFDTRAETVEIEQNLFAEPVYLGEDQIRFYGDSAEYIDSESAIATLTPIANYMQEHSDLRLLLIGTTAGDGYSEYSLTLSRKRAEAVKATLVALGADENKLITLGLGSTDPWHISNVGTGGGLAAMNRKVVLLDASTPMAQNLMAEVSC